MFFVFFSTLKNSHYKIYNMYTDTKQTKACTGEVVKFIERPLVKTEDKMTGLY